MKPSTAAQPMLISRATVLWDATMADKSKHDYIEEWETRCREIEALEFPETFRELLDNAADQYGERKAIQIIDAETALSFSELRAEVRKVANSLYEAGVRKGTRVGVFLPNCIEFPVTWLAIANLGAVMVPTNTAYTGAELDYLYNDAGVDFLVVHENLVAAFESMSNRPKALTDDHIFVVGDAAATAYGSFADLVTDGDADFESPEPLSRDDLLNIQYTVWYHGIPERLHAASALLDHYGWCCGTHVA